MVLSRGQVLKTISNTTEMERRTQERVIQRDKLRERYQETASKKQVCLKRVVCYFEEGDVVL